MGEREFRQEAHQHGHRTIRQQNTSHRTGERQPEGLGKKLALDSPAAGADRAADGKLMLAGGAASQQQDGNVGASDQQQQADGPQQQIQRRTQPFHIALHQAANVDAELLREMRGCVLGELFEQGLQFGIGGRIGDARP